MKRYLIILYLIVLVSSLYAQTYRQRGVVRLITTSSASKVMPVGGVRVAVGNTMSSPSADNGSFSVQVPSKFQLNGVTGGDYILALPTKGKDYYASTNDLDVVVTTKAQKEADYKRLYSTIQTKYNQRAREVLELKRRCKALLDDMDSADRRYASTRHRLDSLQGLYLEYVNHEEAVEREMRRIAEELAMTDYLSLDSLSRRIYELKCQGEWQSISDLLHTVIGGDLADYINQAVLEKQRTEAQLQQAEHQAAAAAQDLAVRFHLVEETIEALKMQHLNDSVSRMYQILTDAAPDNWGYLSDAGIFEHNDMANYDRALYYHQRAAALKLSDSLLATTYSNIGLVHRSKDDYANALTYIEKALDIRLSILGENHLDVANSYNCMGTVCFYQCKYTNALTYFEKALNIRLSVLSDIHPDVAAIYNNMGLVYTSLGDYTTALSYYDKALNILLPIFGDLNTDIASSYSNKGSVYSSLGDYTTALSYYEKALNIQLSVFGEIHPNVATSYNDIGLCLSAYGDHTTALSYYERALEIQLAIFGESHSHVATSYGNIGGAYFHQGSYTTALSYYEKALNIQLSVFGEIHPNVATSYNNIGLVYYSCGEYGKALESFEKALKIKKEVFGDGMEVATAHCNIGYVCDSMREYYKALAHFEEALRIMWVNLGEGHPDTQEVKATVDYLRNILKGNE